jgi:RNAse (barnase) inhibitor barstar
MLEASLLDIDGTFEKGDKYEKDIAEFFDEVNKHLKNVKLWNIRRPKLISKEWVSFGFKVPMNETMFKLIKKPLDLKSYKIEDLYIDISVLWDHFEGEAKCHIELMLKCDFGSPIIVRYSGKEFKPTKTLDILDDKTLISGLLKPAIKNIFIPALKNVDTLIEFMTTNFD